MNGCNNIIPMNQIHIAVISGFGPASLLNGIQSVSVPAYISVSIDAVDLAMVMIHFGYWTLAGSLLGWCAGKGWTGKGLALCFLIVLVYCHYQANQLMAKRFESAIQQAPESLHW